MEERSLRVLEFTKIRDRLCERAVGEPGRELCAALAPMSDLQEVRLALSYTDEADVCLSFMGTNPVHGYEDIRPCLTRAALGAALSMRELLACASFLRAVRGTKKSLQNRDEQPLLRDLAMALTSLSSAEEAISAAIISEEEMADNASPALGDIRRKKRVANDRIRDRLQAFLHSQTTQKYLQEPIITMRSGRYVLPVKQEARQFVPGIVHDQSGSGATLFIEPMAVVEINNDLRQLSAEEAEEIERILAALTAMLAPDAQALRRNVELLAELDFCFAKASLGRSMRGVAPELNERGYIHLKRARHPLLNQDTVVPIDLWLGEQFTTLVVTGPNTGGKTVTLKTVGLLTLMAQAGLFIPADLGSQMPVFDAVYADIGDEQSIEQSLSTFSGHMTNIVHIVQLVGPGSLALFDELGAGTDPTEGAALAMAVLDHLRGKHVRTLATTHYSELKAYALTHEGVENASVEFNVETLRPTYRLSIGVPGKSNAFEISRRLGLPGELIEEAQARLSQEQIRFEDIIQSAEYHRQVAQKERQLAEEAAVEMTRLRDEAERLRRQVEEQRATLMTKAKDEARTLVKRYKQEAEEVIARLRQVEKEASSERARAVQESRKSLDTAISSLTENALPGGGMNLTPPPKDVKVGQRVHIIHLNVDGVVAAPVNQKDELLVQAGLMKLTVPRMGLRLAEQQKEQKRGSGKGVDMAARASVPLQVDVRGMTTDEAQLAVDSYLDEAFLAGLSEVTVVHGKGTGALRAFLQQHFRRHPHIAEFRLGRFGEGEDGVTVVKLK